MVDAHDIAPDEVDGRLGEWMQTSRGGKFFPADPRPEEIFIEDIANGLALDCRYGGQGRTDRYYSVAEHCVHMARYAAMLGWPPEAQLATLLHDGAEGYINDLPRAVKAAVGFGYTNIEHNIEAVIYAKFDIEDAADGWKAQIKKLDRRIIVNEKAAIMKHQQPWAHDRFEILGGIIIKCWAPPVAKLEFLKEFTAICVAGGFAQEETEYAYP